MAGGKFAPFAVIKSLEAVQRGNSLQIDGEIPQLVVFAGIERQLATLRGRRSAGLARGAVQPGRRDMSQPPLSTGHPGSVFHSCILCIAAAPGALTGRIRKPLAGFMRKLRLRSSNIMVLCGPYTSGCWPPGECV